MNLDDRINYQILILKFLLISGILFMFLMSFISGWDFYAVYTDRGGLVGNHYIYYDLTKNEYLILSLCMSITALVSLFVSIMLLFRKKKKHYLVGLLTIILYILIIFVEDAILQMRFVPKG